MIRDKMPGASPKKKTAQRVTAYDRDKFATRAAALVGQLQELPDRAGAFADSSTTLVLGMIETVVEREVLTPKMKTALGNIERGAERWLAGER